MRVWLTLLLTCALSCAFAAPLAAGELVVTGRFEYEDKLWDEQGWTGEDVMQPVRHADVSVYDLATGKLLGRGRTDDAGEFLVLAKSKKPVSQLAARVDADTRERAKAEKAFPRLRVTNVYGETYAAWSSTLLDPAFDQTVDLGTTSIPKVYAGSRDGHPFNVLDMAVAGFELLVGPEVGVSSRGRGLKLVWPNITGSFALGRKAWIGSADGYDDAVILHEVGHLVHNVYSDSDNPGGVHFFGDSDQDPRLSFGEGWATAFAGLVLDAIGKPAWYVDGKGDAQVGGALLSLSLETSEPYFDAALGAGDEVAVACVLYDMLDHDGDGPGDAPDDDGFSTFAALAGMSAWDAWWQVFTGPVKKAARSSLNNTWDGWVALHGDGAALDPLASVFVSRAIVFMNDAFEPNDKPKDAKQIELAADGEWLTGLTLYSREPGSVKPGNGDRDWFSVELQAGWRVEVETRYPGGVFDATTQADTWLGIRSPSGKWHGKAEWGGQGRNAALRNISVDESGLWRVVVRSRNKVHRYGRYELRVQRVD